jgi:diguanylate cyclase (GGDEF)-like protein
MIARGATGPSMAPYLVVLAGGDVGRVYRLERSRTVIGRAPDAQIVLEDTGVSRHHAAILCGPDGSVRITDLSSRNGTWVEGRRVTEHGLADGERIQLGAGMTLKIGFQDGVEEAFIAQLYGSATRDSLTGVFNRRAFVDHLAREIAWHKRRGRPLTLVLLDIDNFKAINDRYGHATGDAILKQLAEICRGQCRTEDVLARLGGDEFVAVLRGTGEVDGALVAERLRAAVAVAEFLHTKGDVVRRISMTVSIGVVTRTGGEIADSDALLDAADRNMYRSKAMGKNRVSVFGPRAAGQ